MCGGVYVLMLRCVLLKLFKVWKVEYTIPSLGPFDDWLPLKERVEKRILHFIVGTWFPVLSYSYSYSLSPPTGDRQN